MTDIPNDKKLSERFGEAINDGYEALGDLVAEYGDAILSVLRLAEAQPSAIREAVEGEIQTLELIADELAQPLKRDLEVGFRHSPLTDKDRLARYAETCASAQHELSRVAAAIREAVEGERSQAASDVIAERQRQVSAEGWTAEHDDLHSTGELAQAAAVYALHSCRPPTFVFDAELQEEIPTNWPWARRWFKPRGPRRDLVRAGALIIAEIERLDRAAAIRARREEKDQ